MRQALWLLALLTVGCGKHPTPLEFEPFIQAFEVEAAKHGVAVDTGAISFSFDMELETAGVCKSRSEIIINPFTWAKLDDNDREIVLFHELGHCVLGRSHVTEKDIYGAPVSIMAPAPLAIAYRTHRAAYLFELFHPDLKFISH